MFKITSSLLVLTMPLLAMSDFEEYVEHDEFVEFFDEPAQEEVVLVAEDSVVEEVADVDEAIVVAEKAPVVEEVIVVAEEAPIIEEALEVEEEVFFVAEEEIEGLPEEIGAILQESVARGSTVVDFGETKASSKLLASLVGPFGKVLTFDRDQILETFQSSNIEPHSVNLEEIDVDLDELDLDGLTLLKVDAWGNEDKVLKGAARLIAKEHPLLLINMLGGIPVERTDRYVKEEFNVRMDQIKRMGYLVRRINETFYLAVSED